MRPVPFSPGSPSWLQISRVLLASPNYVTFSCDQIAEPKSGAIETGITTLVFLRSCIHDNHHFILLKYKGRTSSNLCPIADIQSQNSKANAMTVK